MAQEKVFDVLMVCHLHLLTTKPTLLPSALKEEVKTKIHKEYCNITDVVVEHFYRAHDGSCYLFKIAPNAGSFENPRFLEEYFPKLDSLVLSGANLNNDAAKILAKLLERRKTLLTSLRELDVSRNKIQVDGLLALVNDFVLATDRPPVFPFTLNWAEQNHTLNPNHISRRLHLACLHSQIPLNISRITSHGLVQERVFKVSPALKAVHPDASIAALPDGCHCSSADTQLQNDMVDAMKLTPQTTGSIGQTVEVASPDTVQLQCIAQLLVNFREEVESRVGNQNVARFLQAALSRGALKVLLGTVACITVVTLGPMHEGQPKDQPVQRRALYLESQVAGHQASTTSNRSRPSAGL